MTEGPEVTTRPPLVHLTLLSLVAIAFLIGGQVTFHDWGRLPVRPLTGYLAFAIVLHAASGFAGGASLLLRGTAWLTVALAPLHLDVLLRAEVLVPVVALGIVDLAQHRTGLKAGAELPAGGLGKGIAALATLALLAVFAVLVPLAKSAGILVRLGATATIGWALLSSFALRPAIRTPGNLLGGVGAFAVSFALLAGPIVPLGPLVTYWVTILTLAAAILTWVITGSETSLREEHRVHEQTTRSLPDPVVAPLAEKIHGFITTGEHTRALSRRVQRVSGQDDEGLADRVDDMRAQGLPHYVARRRALAEALDIDETDPRRQ